MNPSLIPVVDVVAKGIAVLLLAMGILSLWRGASASQRSLVWLLCFGTLLLLPLTMLVQPWWRVPVSDASTVAPLSAHSSAPVTMATEAGGVVFVETVRERGFLPRWTVLQAAGFVWALGVLVVVGWRLMGGLRLRRLRDRTRVCDDVRVRRLFSQVSAEAGLWRSVELREGKQASVPMTWGSLGPVLLLPEESLSWPDNDILAALRHEMGHIKHWDHAARLLTSVVCAVYWFNPLVWIAARRWRTAQEQASDDLVVTQEDHRAEAYAVQLLNAARRAQQEGLLKLPVMTMAQPSTLELRLSAIMDEQRNRSSVRRGAIAMGSANALGLLALCAGFQLHAAEPAKAGQSVSITCRIYESASDAGKQKITALKIDNKKPLQLAPAESEAFIKQLTAIEGVALLSAPQVVTSSGTSAVIKLETNNIYAKDKTGAQSGMAISGIWMDLLPTVNGGDITLEITPTIKDFEGVEMKEGVNQPVVKERKFDAQVTLKPGETAALDGGVVKIGGVRRHIILLVSASLDTKTRTGTFLARGTGRVQMVDEKDPSLASSKVPPKPALLQRAESIIIPSVAFKDATLDEALEFFQVKSRAHDSNGKGVKIVLSSDAAKSPVRLTLNLKNVPLSEALRYTAELTEMELTADEVSISLKKKAAKKQETATKSLDLHGGQLDVRAPATSPALEKAEKLILPKVKFSYTTVTEAVEFLNMQAKQQDPTKQGVNIFLVPGASAKSSQITLDLIDVPLSVATQYVAELADMEVVAEQSALYLRPKAGQK